MGTPADIGNHDPACACAALRRAARSATQFYDLVLQPTGLKVTQFIALRNIAEAGEVQQWRYARQQAIAVETLSRRFSVLRKKGLVSVKIGRNHGERIYALTEQGSRVLADALPYWERAQERFAQTLGEEGFFSLLKMCDNAVLASQEAEKLRTPNAASGISKTARKVGSSLSNPLSLNSSTFHSRSELCRVSM